MERLLVGSGYHDSDAFPKVKQGSAFAKQQSSFFFLLSQGPVSLRPVFVMMRP
jgi:hypothetical protein